ncbi:muscle-related coiled-coil protein-like [Sinocyclocheilus anshuiensis]|uniref:Muscle-related coiled-coil protein-like n=1 Tax=Sinocyclocheilus anshuiensis TaxID=1608454 RepID=A0A671NKI3_9TELE|nr:PREDICTED: muscle-related coiled-coil protein-like [Sinocyclocheilus anshuiensis]
MANKLGLAGVTDEPSTLNIFTLLERVSGIIDNVQACQQRMEERQLELENTVKTIQVDVVKLTKEHTATSSTVEKLLEKTRKVSCHVKDVRVRVEKQNIRVKKVEETQVELLNKNKFRVVIYQGDNEVPAVPASKASPKGATGGDASLDPDAPEALLPDSDEEYMVVEEAESSTAAKLKKTGLKGIESLKQTFSRENMTKTKENLGTKVNKLGERIVTAERREKIRQSGERFKETITKTVPAKLNLKKERTVAEGQEGAEGTTEGTAPVPPPKGRKASPGVAYTEPTEKQEGPDEGKGEESEVPMYDMKQLS